ncbi:hypothetical protein J7T55_009278 [Diaporthe amygdali]|uniref:uncharacterized protein n=1 Tax=Phomopsis amygdali TaxID=1214568 RepID=UPI0022FF1859|nr:uncharacterized protein J7T55_009278 [Diaporthe amygdali]KAJ0118495.1 hypothetical protein J7T55_009278 [Diaporthe amygdali]
MASDVAKVGDREERESCSTCQDLAFRDEIWTPFRTAREDGNLWKVNASYESLRLSSAKGCTSCVLLYQLSRIMLKDIDLVTPELVVSKYGWWWEDSILSIDMEHGDTKLKQSFHIGQVALQLTAHTINDFKQNLPFEELPKTFQDAVTICASLDVYYIWIDSLCILQDSPGDWAIQGSKMTQIYGKQAKTLETQNYQVHIRKRVEMTYMGGFPHHQSGVYDADEGPDDEHLGGYLSRRGWCLQESYLPSRLLHFAIDHVSWHCATDAFCECEYGPLDKNKKRSRYLSDGLEPGRIIDRENLKEDWEGVVTEYTRRRLTFSSDRLAALAGLAARGSRLQWAS